MRELRSLFALILSALVASPFGMSQQPPSAGSPTQREITEAIRYSSKPDVPVAPGTGLFHSLTRPFREPSLTPLNLGNSGRLEALVRAGKLYLSLQDAVALALENNLDIEISRYGPQAAQADYLRAKAGGLLRGVSNNVTQTANSAVSQSTGGTTGGVGSGGTGQSSSGATGGVGGTVITQTGVAIPNLDPLVFVNSSYGHLSRPQSNTITTGTTALIIDNTAWSTGYQQSFLTGTTVNYNWNNTWFKNNNFRSDINPSWGPNMQLQITQRLLQGFGIAVNNRNIRIAKNDLRVSDLVFEQQVMVTVSGIVNLYWDLVSFNENYRVQQKALEVAQKFYSDNRKQVEIGTLAPIEIVRAEARVAEAQQAVTNAETQLLQQETILKSALSRTGVASPTIAEARVIPMDVLRVPQDEALPPISDLQALALANRPEVEQTRVNLTNTKIGIEGSRSQLRPSLDVLASFQNNALSGSVNTVPTPPGQIPVGKNADPYFIGGYGNALSQIFRRNFPDYTVGFQMNIPIRNRTAQADYIRDQITLRQQELGLQRQINDIRVNVQNALTAVLQARAQYQAAQKGRVLQEQTLDAENKKYALGASTAFQVVQTQRDLATAQFAEVSALAAYSRARVQLDLQTAQILKRYSVQIDEAKRGVVARAPSTPPVTN